MVREMMKSRIDSNERAGELKSCMRRFSSVIESLEKVIKEDVEWFTNHKLKLGKVTGSENN
jgi:hypothetical protein